MSTLPAGRRALLLGTSDGIGLGLARRLVLRGWQVVSVSRRPCPVEGLLAHAVQDVATPDFAARLRELQAQHGPFDLCVFLVAIANDFDPTTFADEERVFAVNLLAATTTAQVVVPPMVARGRGHFVGVSSLADELLLHGSPAYSASKAALSSWLCSIAKPLRARGVAVTNVRFGFVDTKLASAPWRPSMLTVERAVDALERVIARRPVQLSIPKHIGLAVRVLRWLQRPGVWFGAGPR